MSLFVAFSLSPLPVVAKKRILNLDKAKGRNVLNTNVKHKRLNAKKKLRLYNGRFAVGSKRKCMVPGIPNVVTFGGVALIPSSLVFGGIFYKLYGRRKKVKNKLIVGTPEQIVKQEIVTEDANSSQIKTEDVAKENNNHENIKKINILGNNTLKDEGSLKGQEHNKFNFRFIKSEEIFEDCESGMRGHRIPFLEVKNGKDQTQVIVEVSVDGNEDFDGGRFLSFTVRDNEIGKAEAYRNKIAQFFGWEKLKLDSCTKMDDSGGMNEYDNGLENHFKMFWFKNGKTSLSEQDREEIHSSAPPKGVVCYTMNISGSV